VENAQVAVYLMYASDAGHALIDRELYVPRGWIEDPDRCRVAGLPERVGFATKPALATRMLARALDAGVPAAWVTGDEVYGADPKLRAELEARGIGYVLAVACNHRVVAAGTATAPMICSGGFRRGPGSACPPDAAPRATVCTTGHSSAWTTTPFTWRPGAALAAGPPQPQDR
jgi:SRSO17 transposase